MSSIADRLRLLRIMWGEESARSLSLSLGISAGAWNVWERGSSAPSAEVLTALAGRGVNINWLLTGEGLPLLSQKGATDLSTAIEWMGQQQASRLGLGRLALAARRARILHRTQVLTCLTAAIPEGLTLAELSGWVQIPSEDLLGSLLELVEAGLVEATQKAGMEAYRASSLLTWTSIRQETDAAALAVDAVEFLVNEVASGVHGSPDDTWLLSATIGVPLGKEYLAALKDYIMTHSNQSESKSQTIKLVIAAKIRNP